MSVSALMTTPVARPTLGLALGMRRHMRASAAPLSQQLMCLRMNSTKGPNKADDTSAQKKLDELADFLESQPQEKTRPMRAPRAKLDQSQPESFRGPTKVFQNGYVRAVQSNV